MYRAFYIQSFDIELIFKLLGPKGGCYFLSSFRFPTVSDYGVHEQGFGAGVGHPDHVHARAAFKPDTKAGRRQSQRYPDVVLFALRVLHRKPAFKAEVLLSFTNY